MLTPELTKIIDKAESGNSLSLEETLAYVDSENYGDTMVVDNYSSNEDSTDRDIMTELGTLKLNVRISQNISSKKFLDLTVYNHAKKITYIRLDDSGMATTVVGMYKRQYELSVYSQSRFDKTKELKDDFVICIQAYDHNKLRAVGDIVEITDVTYVSDSVLENASVVDYNVDAKVIGTVSTWTLMRSLDKTIYFFKKSKKKLISASTLQTAVEKFVVSSENKNGLDIDTVKAALGISDVEFANDLSLSEKRDATKKKIGDLLKGSTNQEDLLAQIAITAIRDLSPNTRQRIISELEVFASDPEMDVENVDIGI